MVVKTREGETLSDGVHIVTSAGCTVPCSQFWNRAVLRGDVIKVVVKKKDSSISKE